MPSGSLTSQCDVGHALVFPTSTTISMVSGKPNLPQISGESILRSAFPNSRAERGSRLIQSQSLEGMLYSIREIRIVPLERT